MNLSDNLKKIRKEHNLSQEQLAEQLGVSRQSVSKWESNQAYPEMDKMIQLCKIFNLNIDDLLNQDIKEVNNTKQSKMNINKYIDDFLDYITKTIDMFSNMKFKQKVKCIFEQLLILGIITLILVVVGVLGEAIVSSLFSFLPINFYYFIFNVIEAIYLTASIILAIILLLHIFKVRYLDYYNVVSLSRKADIENEIEEKNTNEITKDNKKNKGKFFEKKDEKIIIRDPEHSGYKFISGLLRTLLFVIKGFAVLFAITFCLSLVALAIAIIVSFLFIKTGLLFMGIILILISLIYINLIILNILYNFIVSKKSKKGKLALSFLTSLFIAGIGIGMTLIGITKFDVIDDIDSDYFIVEEQFVKMTDDLFFENYYGTIEYVESENKDIKIVFKHSKYYDSYIEKESNEGYYFGFNLSESNTMNIIRGYINDINNKKIVDYSNNKIYIYTTKENIETLKNNLHSYWNQTEEIQRQNVINDYEQKIRELTEKIEEKNNKIYELEEKING